MKALSEKLASLIRKNGVPVYIYSDGVVTHEIRSKHDLIGVVWGHLQKGEEEIQVGWYAFQNGKFSDKVNAYQGVKGVVAWVNPDLNAPPGKRGLILTPEQVRLRWSDDHYLFDTTREKNGLEKSKNIMKASMEQGISCPAVVWCVNYSAHGIKAGEGFLPSSQQLSRILENANVINCSLEKIKGVPLHEFYWSCSEQDRDSAQVGMAGYRDIYTSGKKQLRFVRCVVAF